MCYPCTMCNKCGMLDKINPARLGKNICFACSKEMPEGAIVCPHCGKSVPLAPGEKSSK